MIAIIDYGMGNLGSVQKALAFLGYDSEITNDPARVMDADGVVLPGVGAIGAAMEALTAKGLDKVVHEYVATGKPFLGICLGMQMLFDTSEESFGGEPVKGLSVLPGKVVKFPSDMGLKIPQIGWNELNSKNEILPNKEYVYFVHSYYCVPERHAQELLAMQIASLHNLAFYLWLVGEARKHVIAGDFAIWKPKMVEQVSQRL